MPAGGQTLALADDQDAAEAAGPDDLQERLINWGYAVCDAAIRTHMPAENGGPPRFPYPDRGVG